MGGLSPSSRPPPEMPPPEEEMRWRSRARPPAPERARELHSRARNLNRISMLLADEMLQVGVVVGSNKEDGVAGGGGAGAAGAGVVLGAGGGRAAGGGRLGSSISLPSLGSHPISSDLHRISLPSVGAAHRVGERVSERLAARERTRLPPRLPRRQV